MIFLSAQPDDIYFIWQLQVLTQNLKDLEVEKDSIKILVGYKGETYNQEWNKWINTIHGDIIFIKDDRQSSQYLSSLRPHIIKKFFRDNTKYNNTYVFYHDADILFSELPNFIGMSDGRVHVSSTSNYTGYNSYIKLKKVPQLEEDLRNVIGIAETTLDLHESNTGGAQYYFKGLLYDFWDKIEKDCETFWITYHNNKLQYDITYNKNFNVTTGCDLQIWTTDMWCVQWNLWMQGIMCYANPELDFSWPNESINLWTQRKIYHNSGTYDNTYFDKLIYKEQFPYGKIDKLEPKSGESDAIQQMYINAIIKKGNELGYNYVKPIHENSYSCIYLCKNPDVEIINVIISNFLQQTVMNKELIVFNYGDSILPNNNNVRIYNLNKSLITGEYYATEEEVYSEVQSLALNNVIVKWNYQEDINYLKNL